MANNTAWHRLPLKEVYKKLNTSEKGLTGEWAEKRLQSFGPNELPKPEIDSWWIIFFRQFKNSLIYVLLIAAAIVFWLGEYVDGGVILFVLAFNAIVGSIQEGRAQSALIALQNFVETFATVLRDGKESLMADKVLVPGDVIVLMEGDKVSADCRLIIANNLRIDEASLTGESTPVKKIVGYFSKKRVPVVERSNMVFKGTNVVGGNAKALVVGTGLNTEIGKISSLIADIDTEIPFQANLRELSHLVIGAVIVVSLALLGIAAAKGDGLQDMFLVAVTLAVSVIPEGLPIVSTLILAFGVMRMARRNALVKRLQAVEALGQARVIAVDKTGTITRNEMVIRQVFINNRFFEITGEGFKFQGKALLGGEEVKVSQNSDLYMAAQIASFCASARLSKGRVIGDPTEVAMLVLGKKLGLPKDVLENKYPQVAEIPFDHVSKYHVTVHQMNDNKYTTVVGAPETVFNTCTKIWRDGKAVAFSDKEKERMKEIVNQLSQNGLRILAFSFANADLKSRKGIPEMVFAGFYAMEDAIRKEVVSAVRRVKKAGMRTIMITGDHKLTAIAIARQAGIYKEGDLVLTDRELERMSKRELSRVIDKVTVFARISPRNKTTIIDAYRSKGEIVAMTGDGVNDAPSLVAADLGVAMGGIGTSVSKDASDIILLDDNFGTIVAAVEEGRHVYQTIKKTILYLFSTSIGEVMAIFGSILLGWPLLLVPTQIIWLNLVTDGFLDISFAWEPKSKGLLKGTFEHSRKYFIDKTMVLRSFLMGTSMMISALVVFSLNFQDNLPKALTMSLTTLAIMQWFNAWNVRSENKSIFMTNPLSNKVLLGATFVVIMLQLLVVYWKPFQSIFQTVPLTLSDWLLAIGVSSLIIVVEEIRKFFYRLTMKK
jgi:Ca2+-transporting ATPase